MSTSTATQTYRLAASQRWFVFVPGGLLVLGQLIAGTAALAGAFVALLLLVFLAQGWERVKVDAHGLTLRSWRTSTIPWSEVRRIEPHRWFGTRAVRIERSDGQRRSLPVPVDGPLRRDPAFDAKVDAIRASWTRAVEGKE